MTSSCEHGPFWMDLMDHCPQCEVASLRAKLANKQAVYNDTDLKARIADLTLERDELRELVRECDSWLVELLSQGAEILPREADWRSRASSALKERGKEA